MQPEVYYLHEVYPGPSEGVNKWGHKPDYAQLLQLFFFFSFFFCKKVGGGGAPAPPPGPPGPPGSCGCVHTTA